MTRLPAHIRDAVDTAAAQSFIRPAAYVRQALCEKLQREGHLSPEGARVERVYLTDRTPENA